MPQAVKMDLRAFWRVVAMVSGISVCHSDRRPGLVASQFLLYVIYNSMQNTHSLEHTLDRTHVRQQKQHRKMKEKSAGGKRLADLILL